MALLLAVGAILSAQAGAALSVPLLFVVGPAGTTWLRYLGAISVLWIVERPSPGVQPRRGLVAAVALGAATCGMAVSYAEAITRIPLGLATAIEFCGPLAVAIAASRRAADLGWAVLAGAGVVLLTLNGLAWSGDPVGLVYAMVAAACWALYIVLTKWVGQAFRGLQGLTVSLTAAAVIATPLALGQLRAAATPWSLAAAIALGFLSPLLPYALEMLALRRMSARGFGILMSAEPAMAALMGWLILGQSLDARRVLGIGCVAAASIGATAARDRSPRRA